MAESPQQVIHRLNRIPSGPVSPASTPPALSHVTAGSPIRKPRTPTGDGSPSLAPLRVKDLNAGGQEGGKARHGSPIKNVMSRMRRGQGSPSRKPQGRARPPAKAPLPARAPRPAGGAPAPRPTPAILRQGRKGPALPAPPPLSAPPTLPPPPPAATQAPAPMPSPFLRSVRAAPCPSPIPKPLPSPASARPAAAKPVAAKPTPAAVNAPKPAVKRFESFSDRSAPPLPPRSGTATPLPLRPSKPPASSDSISRKRASVHCSQMDVEEEPIPTSTSSFGLSAEEVSSLPPAPLPPSVSKASGIPGLPSLTGVAIPLGSETTPRTRQLTQPVQPSNAAATPRASTKFAGKTAISRVPLSQGVLTSPMVISLISVLEAAPMSGCDTSSAVAEFHSSLTQTLAQVCEHGMRYGNLRRQANGKGGKVGAASAWAVMEQEESMAVVELLCALYLSPSRPLRTRRGELCDALLQYDTEAVLEHLVMLLQPSGAATNASSSSSASASSSSIATGVAVQSSMSSVQDPLRSQRRIGAEMLAALAMHAQKKPMDMSTGESTEPTAGDRFIEALHSQPHFSSLCGALRDADPIIKSHMNALFACIDVSASQLLPDSARSRDRSCNSLSSILEAPDTSTNPYEGVQKVATLLHSRQAETREAALVGLQCMGPMAAGAVKDIAAVLTKDRAASLRLLAMRILADLGMPYCLVVLKDIQEVARKDKDEAVRSECAEFLQSLSSQSSFPALNASIQSSVNDPMVVVKPAAQAGSTPSAPVNRRASVSLKYSSTRRRKETSEEAAVKTAIAALGTQQSNLKSICSFIETNNPEIVAGSEKWKRHVKSTIKRMVERGMIDKRPATYAL